MFVGFPDEEALVADAMDRSLSEVLGGVVFYDVEDGVLPDANVRFVHTQVLLPIHAFVCICTVLCVYECLYRFVH